VDTVLVKLGRIEVGRWTARRFRLCVLRCFSVLTNVRLLGEALSWRGACPKAHTLVAQPCHAPFLKPRYYRDTRQPPKHVSRRSFAGCSLAKLLTLYTFSSIGHNHTSHISCCTMNILRISDHQDCSAAATLLQNVGPSISGLGLAVPSQPDTL
jgi:hypothetical protein